MSQAEYVTGASIAQREFVMGTLQAVSFHVWGTPVAKQSFRVREDGRHYQSARVKDWQRTVAQWANVAMSQYGPMAGDLSVSLEFYMPNRRRVDLDNLSKAVCDALQDIVYQDDKQIVELHLAKFIDRDNPGVGVQVRERIGG